MVLNSSIFDEIFFPTVSLNTQHLRLLSMLIVISVFVLTFYVSRSVKYSLNMTPWFFSELRILFLELKIFFTN